MRLFSRWEILGGKKPSLTYLIDQQYISLIPADLREETLMYDSRGKYGDTARDYNAFEIFPVYSHSFINFLSILLCTYRL